MRTTGQGPGAFSSPAAISSTSSSAGKYCRNPASWSPPSRPGASTPAPRRRSGPLLLADLAAAGAPTGVLISQDLDEIFSLCDRIRRHRRRRLSPTRPVGEVTIEEIGLLMGGGRAAAGLPTKQTIMLVLEPRGQQSIVWSYGSRLLALVLTLITTALIFAILGKDPGVALYTFSSSHSPRETVCRNCWSRRHPLFIGTIAPMSGTSAPKANTPSARWLAANWPMVL